MVFKNAQASMPVYMFDRNSLSLSTGKVMSVIPSHVDIKAGGKMVVDIAVLFDGTQNTYTIDDSLTIAYVGSCALSLDLDSVLREIESRMNESSQILSERPYHENVVTTCRQLLMEHNPTLKKEKELEERFTGIDAKFEALNGKMDSLVTLLQSKSSI